MNANIIKIADELKNNFLNESSLLNEISIFLCGGSSLEELNFRRNIGKKISMIISNYKYSVYYPEDMFIELILGHQKQNLLTLENLLADSVNAVVILLQSPGTFAELGAFANYEKLSNKLIVIINPKYARSRSFINYGPIRYLRTKTKSKVIYLSMNNSNLSKLVKQIAEASREVSKNSSPIRDLSNPIFAYRFYLALIYIFDPVPKDSILAVANSLIVNKNPIITTATETVLNSLINERKATFSSGLLSITSKGIDDLIYKDNTRKKIRMLSEFLTKLRLDALNLIFRKDFRKVWGEAK